MTEITVTPVAKYQSRWDYRRRIESNNYHLTTTLKAICDYLMVNYTKAAMSTAAEIAHVVGCDTTAVVRCAQALGFRGWPELQQQMRDHALAEIEELNGPGLQLLVDALRAWCDYDEAMRLSMSSPGSEWLAVGAAKLHRRATRLTADCLDGAS